MEKKTYVKAVAETIVFDNSDLLTDDTPCGGGCSNGGGNYGQPSGPSWGPWGC